MASKENLGKDQDDQPLPSPVAAFIEAAAAASAVPMARKGKYCCVVGCQNNQGRDSHRGIKFHTFPKDPERRERWNKAVNRTVPGKSYELWRASQHDVICSEHFVGGKRCDTVDSSGYIPSIFPTHEVKSRTAQDIARENRYSNRKRNFNSTWTKKQDNIKITTHETTPNVLPLPLDTHQDELPMDIPELLDQPPPLRSLQQQPTATKQQQTVVQKSQFSSLPSSSAVSTRPIMIDYCGQVSLPPRPTDISLNFCDIVSGTEKATICLSGWKKEVKVRNRAVQTQNTDYSLAFSEMSDRQIKAFTGVDKKIIKFLSLQASDSVKESNKFSREQKITLLLIRLKLMIPFSALGAFFNVSESTAQKVFNETMCAIYNIAKDGLIWYERDIIKARMPSAFRALFPQTRAIIDCSEIACERASKVRQRVQMYSHYKSRFTVKFLVAVAPSGEITFVSRTFGGRSTDTEITCNSGFLDLIEEGDVILGDKGFPVIQRDLNQRGGFLVMPPFKSGEKQFNAKQNEDGYRCASVRIHVERAIARLKLFECLKYVPIHMIPHIDQALVIVCYLTNLFNDLIKDDDE